MPWVDLSIEDVRSRFTAAELDALQNDNLSVGQADPIEAVLEQVCQEVRGYVAVQVKNATLAEGRSIPSNLVSTALALIRYRVASRYPHTDLMTDARRSDYMDALRLLERVADGKFAIPAPPTDQESSETLNSHTGSWGYSDLIT